MDKGKHRARPKKRVIEEGGQGDETILKSDLDFLEVKSSDMRKNIHNEMEEKLAQLKRHFDRLTGEIRRFLKSGKKEHRS